MTSPETRPRQKSGYINARVTPALKEDAERVLSELGVSTTEAITMFLRQVVLRRGLPFPVRIPNAQSVTAFEEARERPETLETHESVGAMMNDLWPE